MPAPCHSQWSRRPAQSPGRRGTSRVSGRRDADEAVVLIAPTARRPDVLVPMICAHVLARSAYSQSARDRSIGAPHAVTDRRQMRRYELLSCVVNGVDLHARYVSLIGIRDTAGSGRRSGPVRRIRSSRRSKTDPVGMWTSTSFDEAILEGLSVLAWTSAPASAADLPFLGPCDCPACCGGAAR